MAPIFKYFAESFFSMIYNPWHQNFYVNYGKKMAGLDEKVTFCYFCI